MIKYIFEFVETNFNSKNIGKFLDEKKILIKN